MLCSRGFKIYWLVLAAVLVIVPLPFDDSVSFALDEYGMDLADMILQESNLSAPVHTKQRRLPSSDPIVPEDDFSSLLFHPPL